MKKILTVAIAALLACSTTYAQEAFKALGISVEAGTTGLGVNLSFPLVTNHLIFTAGYNFPTYSYTKSFSTSSTEANEKINEANDMIDRYNSAVADGLISGGNLEHISNIGDPTADLTAKIDFTAYKFMLEYYPTTSNRFHLTAGVAIGQEDFITVNALLDQQTWNAYKTAISDNNKLLAANGVNGIKPVEGLDDALRYNIDDETYCFNSSKSVGQIDAAFQISKVKPYLGLGFGGAIPRHRVGFTMEIGAYYQGKMKIVSDDTVAYDSSADSDGTVDDIISAVKKVSIYPVISFRLTGRLFGKGCPKKQKD